MHKRLAKSLLGCVSVAALIAPVHAADMAIKTAPTPPPVFTWSGFYGGAHFGGGWLSDPNDVATMQRFTGAPPTPHPLQTGTFQSFGFPFGGLQLGYNWRLGNIILGLETDISVARNQQDSTVFLTEGPINDTVTNTHGVDWFGTVRGRIGFLVNPSWLAYFTGGYAYGRTRNDFAQSITGPGPVGVFGVTTGPTGASSGYTLGGGLEYAIDAKWSVKGEYQYIAFRDGMTGTTAIQFTPGKGGNMGVFNGIGGNTKAQTFQIGLNYHFWGM